MIQNIIKSTIALSIVTTSLLAGGNASGNNSARLTGLGLSVYQTADSYNIWANPAFLNTYQNEATLNITGQNTTAVMAGASFGTSVGTFAAYYGRNNTNNSANMNSNMNTVAFNTAKPNNAILTPVNLFDIMYAYDMNGIDLGARFSYKGNQQNSEGVAGVVTNTNTYYSSEMEFEFGAIMRQLNLDFSATFTLPKYEDSSQTTAAASQAYESDGAMIFDLRGGYNLPLSSQNLLRVTAQFSNASLNSKATDTPVAPAVVTTESRTDGITTLNAYGTLDSTLDSNTHLFLSAGLIYGSQATELTNSNVAPVVNTETLALSGIMLPLSGAVESKITQNWTVRAGASFTKWLYNSSTTEVVGATKLDQSTTVTSTAGLNVGFGYHPTDALSVDASLRQGVLFGGGNVLANLTGLITANYRFGPSGSSSAPMNQSPSSVDTGEEPLKY